MGADASTSFEQAFSALRQFARPRPPVERCELCGAALVQHHPHLIELASRKIACACDACALLFEGMAHGRYKRVPRDARLLTEFQMPDALWEGLLIPINMAFFFHSSLEDRVVAMYPSPAGAVESLLSLESWNVIVEENPVLRHLQPDVEALLVNRIGRSRASISHEHFIAPIDACYRLVGLIRMHWKGLSGGTEVWQEIESFFAQMRNGALVLTGDRDA